MDPDLKFPTTPGLPLFPVSPERMNRQFLPQSPSESSIHSPSNARVAYINTHSRTSSDVQGKVAQFNNLSKEAAQRRKENEAALKRAVVGREEAESETRRLREENRVLKKELEQGQGRERRVGERVETVMEEMQRLKETQVHSQSLYEKEIRRARKEAFKSSSAVVKLQEELKTTRNRSTLMREEAEAQKRKVQEVEKDCFAAQYQLVGVQEELEKLQQQIRTVEAERDALRTSLQEEEVARIAAEGRIPLPLPDEPDEFSSPKRTRPVEMAQPVELEQPAPKKQRTAIKSADEINWEKFWETGELAELGISNDPNDSAEEREYEIEDLKTQLRWQIRAREKSDKLVEHMQMECQFRMCSCRLAEELGRPFIHDDSVAEGVKNHKGAADRGSQNAGADVRCAKGEKEKLIEENLHIEQNKQEHDEVHAQENNRDGKFEDKLEEPMPPVQQIQIETDPQPRNEEQRQEHDRRMNKEEELEESFSPTAHSVPDTPSSDMAIDEPDSDSEPLIEFSPTTGTFRTIAIPQNLLRPQPPQQQEPLDDPFQSTFSLGPPPLNPIPLSNSPSTLNLEPSPPPPQTHQASTESPAHFPIPPISPTSAARPRVQPASPTPSPRTPYIQSSPHTKTITTTTTIPLADPTTPTQQSTTPARHWITPFKSPATMSRAEALESIQRRRELRARSVAISVQGESTPARDTNLRRAASARRVATTPSVVVGRRERSDTAAPVTPATTGRRVVTAPAGKGV